MVSIRATLRAGYYILKTLPQFLGFPLEMRSHLGRARDAFEEALIQDGLDRRVAHELAKVYHEANRELMKQMTSPRAWV